MIRIAYGLMRIGRRRNIMCHNQLRLILMAFGTCLIDASTNQACPLYPLYCPLYRPPMSPPESTPDPLVSLRPFVSLRFPKERSLALLKVPSRLLSPNDRLQDRPTATCPSSPASPRCRTPASGPRTPMHLSL